MIEQTCSRTTYLYSVYLGSEDTIEANSRPVGLTPPYPCMPFSTGICRVDLFSVVHSSFSSSYSLWTVSRPRESQNLDAKTMDVAQSRLSLSPFPQPYKQRWLTENTKENSWKELMVLPKLSSGLEKRFQMVRPSVVYTRKNYDRV